MIDFIAKAQENIETFDFGKVKLFDDDLPLLGSINLTVDGFDFDKYKNLINKLTSIQPNQLYTPQDKLHITVLPFIKPEYFEKMVDSEIDNIFSKYKISFEIICADFRNYSTMMITIKPKFDLAKLRQELRDFMDPDKNNWTLYTNGFEEIGHINTVRYLEIPKVELLKSAFKQVNSDFGIIKPQKVQIIKLSSRTLVDGKFSIEKEIKLTKH